MIYYLSTVFVLYLFLLSTDWDAKHNKSGSVKFKLLFCFISALIFPVFIITMIIDGVYHLWNKVFK